MSNPFFSALIAGQDLTEGLGPELLEQEVGLLGPDVKNRQSGPVRPRFPDSAGTSARSIKSKIQPGLALLMSMRDVEGQ
jgi:hypothetical protein